MPIATCAQPSYTHTHAHQLVMSYNDHFFMPSLRAHPFSIPEASNINLFNQPLTAQGYLRSSCLPTMNTRVSTVLQPSCGKMLAHFLDL